MRLIPLFVACACLFGCAEGTVTRVVDGREVRGRFISDRAYALYAIGADAEAHGDFARAAAAYEEASREDPASSEILTRVGAVRCLLGLDADAAFARAEKIDATYEPLFRARARCLLAGRRFDEALIAVQHAAALDPDAEDDVVLEAEVFDAMGKRSDAIRVLRALAVRSPSSVAAWRGLASLGAAAKDAGVERAAVEQLRRLAGTPDDRTEAARALPAVTVSDVDGAIRMGDIAAARRIAKRLHMTSGALAARAAALGDSKLAREEAELVLGADPEDVSARVALACAADLTNDTATVERALDGIGAARGRLSPLARALFAELLARRVGEDAARAFFGAAPRRSASGDALLDAIEGRVIARIASHAPTPAARGEGAAR